LSKTVTQPLPPELTEAGVACIFGQRGYGKSTLARTLFRSTRRPRRIVIDTLKEYYDVAVPVACTADNLRHWTEQPEWAIAATPDPEQFDPLCRFLAAQTSNILILVEEIDQYTTASVCPPGLRALVNYGRHYGQQVVAVARRAADVPRLVTAQAVIASFRQTEPRDLAYLRTFTQADPSTLPKYTYVVCEPDSVERHSVTPSPTRHEGDGPVPPSPSPIENFFDI